MEWSYYRVTVRHDRGRIKIYTYAPSEESARTNVRTAERCPDRSIRAIRRLARRPRWL